MNHRVHGEHRENLFYHKDHKVHEEKLFCLPQNLLRTQRKTFLKSYIKNILYIL